MQDLLDYISKTPLRIVAPSVWYPTALPKTPTLLVMKIPELLSPHRNDSPTSLNRHFKVIFSETLGDQAFLEGCLDRPLPVSGNVVGFRQSVDKTNGRPSSFPQGGDLLLLHYAPPEEGWPHFAVGMSPFNTVSLKMRQRYAWFAHKTELEAFDRLEAIRNS